MRTTIEIDDRLIRDALRCSGVKSKRGTVEEALRLLVQARTPVRKERVPASLEKQP